MYLTMDLHINFQTLTSKLLISVGIIILHMATNCQANSKDILHPAEEYCEGSTFIAQCQENRRILIVMARYGRMHEGKCITGGNMDCHTDVISILDESCSGRTSCSVHVVDVFQKLPEHEKLCSKIYRGFLEVSYKCVTVLKPKGCIVDMSAVTEPKGYLPSSISNETRCGISENPWLVKIAPEQRINMFLMDFAVYSRNPQDLIGGTASTCKVYAVIKEEKVRNSDTVCGQYEREKLVYTSMSEEIQIRIMEKHHHFLMRYEVIGCGGLKVPTGGWIKRKGDIAEIGCEGTELKWTLRCEGNKWSAEPGNCTGEDGLPIYVGASSSKYGGDSVFGSMFGSHWLTILAVIAIAITVAICILVGGIIYIKRKHVYFSNTNHPLEDPNNASYKYGTGSTYPTNQHGGQSLYNEQGIPYRAFDPNDHEYLKTIERQRLMLIGQHPQQHFATINQFNWPPDPATTHTTRHGTVEHIYEMPKFETDPAKQQAGGGERVIPPPPPPPSAAGRLHCFDLDPPPEAIRSGIIPTNNNSTSNTNTGDIRNMNNRSV